MAVMAGDLVTRLGLDARKFQSGLQKAQGQTKSFASVVGSTLGKIKSHWFAMAAAAGTVAGAVYVVQGRIAKLAGIADESAKTGLSGEFLQQLGYAADQSGISIETLTTATKQLGVVIGSGGKGIESLGLNLQEIKSLSPEQQFLRVAEQISKLPTAADRAAASVKVFGRAGKDMTTLFAGGVNDLTKLLKEADALGIGLSNEDLAMAARADDAIQRMKASMGALLDRIIINFAPAIESIANKLTQWMTPLNQFMEGFNTLPNKMEYLGQVISAAFDVAFESIKAKWQETLASMTKASLDFAFDVTTLLNPVEMAKKGAGAIHDWVAGGPPAAEPANGLAAAQAKFNALMQQVQAPPAWQGPRLPAGGGGGEANKLGPAVADIINRLEGPFAGLKMAGQGIVDRAKLQAHWWGGLVENMFTGERPEADAVRKASPQLAGAMQRGGADAYSTIVQAMVRTQDPVVKATEKQTKDLIKGLKPAPAKEWALIKDFFA